MDVTTLIATALRGVFVLAGDLTSRVASRRQADQQRQVAWTAMVAQPAAAGERLRERMRAEGYELEDTLQYLL